MSEYVAPGLHLLIDFWGASNLQDINIIEKSMRDAATACGATVLDVKLHGFGADAGVTGVAILAESHISIHTWAETGYIAIDIFMCGKCDPNNAIPILTTAFNPEKTTVQSYLRGSDKDK